MRPMQMMLGSIALAVAGCSIEQTRALGDECLQTRECVSGLVCLPGNDGRNVCIAISEAGLPGTLDAGNPPMDANGGESGVDASDVSTDEATTVMDVSGP